jgi:hypothetical protein
MPWWWPKKKSALPAEHKYAADYFADLLARLDAVERKYGHSGIVDLVRDISLGQLGQFTVLATDGFPERDGRVLGPPNESEFPAWADFQEDLVFQSQYYAGLQSYVEVGPGANKPLLLLLYIGHILDGMAVSKGLDGVLYLAPDAAGVNNARRTFDRISLGFQSRHEFQTYADADQQLLRRCILLCDLDWTDGSRVDGMARERAPEFVKRLLKNENSRQVFIHQQGETSAAPTPLEVAYREQYPFLLNADAVKVWREIFPRRLQGWHQMFP